LVKAHIVGAGGSVFVALDNYDRELANSKNKR